MSGPLLVADFATSEEYLAAHDHEVSQGGMLIAGVELPPGTPLSDCTVVVRIGGAQAAQAEARLAAATPGVGVTVIFASPPQALVQLAARLREPAAASEQARAPLSLQEKFQLAGTGAREVRFQLLRDPNKQLHAMVLKNPRITLEEVQWAARQGALSPDALKLIAEHAEWSQNATVAAALVRNPKTPLPLAVKLVARLPASELRALAKSQGRPPVVQAAKKFLLR